MLLLHLATPLEWLSTTTYSLLPLLYSDGVGGGMWPGMCDIMASVSALAVGGLSGG